MSANVEPRYAGRRYRSRGWPCPRPSDFAILVVHARHDILLQLSGRLHAEGAEAFEECVSAAISDAPRRLVVDCSGLGTIDRACVDSFLRARQSAHDADIAFMLDAPNDAVQNVLRAAATNDTFSVR